MQHTLKWRIQIILMLLSDKVISYHLLNIQLMCWLLYCNNLYKEDADTKDRNTYYEYKQSNMVLSVSGV